MLYGAVLIAIVAVDAALGGTAEYLNAYELLRSSLGLDWPARGGRFLFGQEQLGRAAIPLAFVAWLAEAALVAWVIYGCLLRWR